MPLRPAFRAPSDETDCMNERRAFRQFPYRRSPDQDRRDAHRPVVVVGAGPVGLCAAIDLAQRGVPVVLLDDADRIGEGSRGICWPSARWKSSTGSASPSKCLEKGVTWKVGKVFQRDALLYRVRPPAGGRAQDAGLHQPAAVLPRAVPGASAPASSTRSTSAGATR